MRRRNSFGFLRPFVRVNRRRGRRLTAAVLCVAIVAQAGLADAAVSSVWAERRRAVPPAVAARILPPLPDSVVKPAAPQPAGAAFASLIPAHLGTLRSFGTEPGPASVLLIQDVHLNSEAQANIAAALSSLFNSRSIDLVGLEGAEGSLGIERLMKAPDPASLSLAADFLLQKNLISGAARAALDARVSLPVIGLDDKRLHEENAAAYRRSVPAAKSAKTAVAAARADVSRQKAAVYHTPLRSFDAAIAAYRDGRQPFVAYARMLVATANRLKRPVPAGLGRFVALADLESSLDLPAVERERSQIVARLAGRLNDAGAHRLLALGNAFRAGLVSHAAFYAEFAAVCRASGIDLGAAPALSSYLRYISESDAVDPDATLRDAGAVESALYTTLARSDDERRLIAADRRGYLTARLVSFEMTRPEWEEYATESGAQGATAPLTQTSLTPFEEFYRRAIDRDAALANHLVAAIRDHHARRIAVVAGGFHTAGLLRRLSERGIGTAVFTPAVTQANPGDAAAYLSVFAREKTPLEKLLEGRELFLAENPLPSAAAFDLAHLEAARALATNQPVGPQRSYVEQVTGFQVNAEEAPPGSPVVFDERTPTGKPVRVTVAGASAAGFLNVPEVATRTPRRWRWPTQRMARLAWTRLLSFGSRALGALAWALQPAPLTVDDHGPSESADIRYERARPADWSAVIILRRTAFYGRPISHSSAALNAAENELQQTFLGVTRSQLPGVALVARRGGEILGFLVATVGPGHVADIRELAVDENVRGQGLGKALFASGLTTILRDYPAVIRITVSDGNGERRTTAIAREFGFEEPQPRHLELSVLPERIPSILERVAERVKPRDPVAMARSRHRLEQLRVFMAHEADPNIVGLIVFGGTASGRATSDEPLSYLILTRRGSMFIAATEEEGLFYRRLATTVPFVQSIPRGAISIGDSRTGQNRELDFALSLMFLPVELSGGEVEGNPLPGSALIQDWVVVGRSAADEEVITGRINARLAALREQLEAPLRKRPSMSPMPGGPILPYIENHFSGRASLSFADLETGSGRFVGPFRRLLERAFAHVEALGVESDPQYVTETGEPIVQARPVIPGDYERMGLADASRDVVTINTIESTVIANALIDQAVRIVNPAGLIIVTFEEGDMQAGTTVESQVYERLRAHGFTVELRRFPPDFPRSDTFLQHDDFIFVAHRASEPNQPPASPPTPSGRAARLWGRLGRIVRAIARAFQPAPLMAVRPAVPPLASRAGHVVRSPWISDSNVTLRFATAADLDDVLALRRRDLATGLLQGWRWSEERSRQAFINQFQAVVRGHKSGTVLVLCRGTDAIGYVFGKRSDIDEATIAENVVRANERGRGFGTAQFAEALRLLILDNPKARMITVSDGNAENRTTRTAIRFGFKNVSDRNLILTLQDGVRQMILRTLDRPKTESTRRTDAVLELKKLAGPALPWLLFAAATAIQPAFLTASVPSPEEPRPPALSAARAGARHPAGGILSSPWITDPDVMLTYASPEDLDAILKLRHDELAKDLLPGWFAGDDREREFLDDFRSIVKGRHAGVFLVLWRRNRLIGYGYAYLEGPTRANLVENLVTRSERGKGFGRAMFAERLRLLLREQPDLNSVVVSDGSRSYRTSRAAARFGFAEKWIRKMELLLNPSLRTAVLEELERRPGASPGSPYSAVVALNRRYAERYLDISKTDHARFPFIADFRFSLVGSSDGPDHFVPISVMDALPLLEAAGAGPGTTVVDATGVDGRVALTAAALGAHAISIEPDANFHAMAGEMSQSGTPSPGQGSVTLLHESFRRYDFSHADVVHYCFRQSHVPKEGEDEKNFLPQLSSGLHDVERQLVRQLKPGAVVVLTSSPLPFTDPSLQPFQPELPALHHEAVLRPRFYRKVRPAPGPVAMRGSASRDDAGPTGIPTWVYHRLLSSVPRLSVAVAAVAAVRLYRGWHAAVRELRLTLNANKFVFRDHENLEFWGWQKRAAGVGLIYFAMVYLPLKLGIFLAASTTLHPGLVVVVAVVSIPFANVLMHGLINTFWLLVEPVHLFLLWAARHLDNAAARAGAAALEPASLTIAPTLERTVRLESLSRDVARALVTHTRLRSNNQTWMAELERDLRSQRTTVGVAGMMDRRLPSLAALDRDDFPTQDFLTDLQADLQARKALHRAEPVVARQAAEAVAFAGLTRASAEAALMNLNETHLNVVVFDGMRPDDADRTIARLKDNPTLSAIVIYDPANEATWDWLGRAQKLPNVKLVAAGSAFSAGAAGGRRLRVEAVERHLSAEHLLAPSIHVFAGQGLELDLEGLPASSPFRAALYTILNALASVTANFNRLWLLDASYKLVASQA